MLVILAIFAGLLVISVLATVVYPRLTKQGPAEAEQELTGVGPEATKVDPEPDLTG